MPLARLSWERGKVGGPRIRDNKIFGLAPGNRSMIEGYAVKSWQIHGNTRLRELPNVP
jgi:hypothetical protein